MQIIQLIQSEREDRTHTLCSKHIHNMKLQQKQGTLNVLSQQEDAMTMSIIRNTPFSIIPPVENETQ